MRARRCSLLVVAALAACGPLDDPDTPVDDAVVLDARASAPAYRWPPPLEDQPQFRVLFHLDGGIGDPP